jgi:hypothetical protein
LLRTSRDSILWDPYQGFFQPIEVACQGNVLGNRRGLPGACAMLDTIREEQAKTRSGDD